MEENAIDINISALEEKEKTATSLEDVYGYKVMTEEFQKQIDTYNILKEQEQQLSLEYVFMQEPEDRVMEAFRTVMRAETNTIIGNDYTNSQDKQDNIFIMLGFVILGAMITGMIWTFVEKKWKGKQKRENYSDDGDIYHGSND